MQTETTTQEERPILVASVNFKHSKNMQFPDDPPTDRQVKYLIKLGYSGKIPRTRKDASTIIEDLQQKNNGVVINA